MFLKKTRQKSGRVRLDVCEGWREEARVRQWSVMLIGYVDELEKEHDDPIAWAQSIVDQMNDERKEQTRPHQMEIRPLERIEKGTVNRKNAGSAVVCAVYEALGIEAAIRSFTRGREHAFDLNAALRLLVVERIIGSGTLWDAWERRDRHFFRSDFTEDDVQRALVELAHCKDRICAAMDRSIERAEIAAMPDVTSNEEGRDGGRDVDACAREGHHDAQREPTEVAEAFAIGEPDVAESACEMSRAYPVADALVCHIARTILYLLQRATGIDVETIREELSLMSCTSLDANWWVFNHRTDASDVLVDAVGLPELKLKFLRTVDVRTVLGKARKAGVPQVRQS